MGSATAASRGPGVRRARQQGDLDDQGAKLGRAFAATGEPERVLVRPNGTDNNGPSTAFLLVRGRVCTWWRVKDSNLRSFRDGFTVRSHWPLGQPA
jgi:hypothetical protein